jgi:O-antigen/teichoic acid export membrane protein
MPTESIPTTTVKPRPTRAAAQALLREITDAAAYSSLAARVKYPVGAMLISQTVLTFGATAVLARALGPRAFGEYALALTIAGVFQLVAAFPVESGIPKFLAEARSGEAGPQPARVEQACSACPPAVWQERSRRESASSPVLAFYSAGIWCRLGASAFALLWCALGARWLSRAFHAPGLSAPVLIAAVSLCLLTPFSLYFMACIQGMERPRHWATGNLLTSALVFPFLLFGALGFAGWGQRGLMALIAAGWLAAALACGLLAGSALGFLRPRSDVGPQVRQFITFLLPMWVVPLAGFGARTIMKLLVAKSWSSVALGHFEIALTLLGHMGVIYQACMIVLLPEWARLYARREAGRLLDSLARARGVLVGAAVAYGALLAFGGHWVVPAIFGRDQIGAVPAVRVIGVVMPIMISGWVASATNVVSNRTGNIGKANVIWFSVGVPLSIVLIPPLGALGAALAWLGAYVVFAWYYVSRARPFFHEVEGWAAREQTQVAASAAPAGPEKTGA